MPPNPNQAPTQEEKDFAERVQLFDKELVVLQNKYMLRIVANVEFPGGALLSVPIRVIVTGSMPPKEEVASKPE